MVYTMIFGVGQDYISSLEERDYFGREATIYGFIRDICWRKLFSTHAHGIFPPLSANALSRLFLQFTGTKGKPSGTRLGLVRYSKRCHLNKLWMHISPKFWQFTLSKYLAHVHSKPSNNLLKLKRLRKDTRFLSDKPNTRTKTHI